MHGRMGRLQLTFRYSCMQGSFWMGFATIMGFSSVFLLSIGYHNTEIGIIIALSGIISALLQPVVASLADGAYDLKTLIYGTSIGILIMGLSILMLSICSGSRIMIGILYGGCLLLLQLAFPLVNAAGTEAINHGQSLNWGAARGVGSVAYAAVSCMLGILTNVAGTIIVPLFILFCFVAFIIAVFRFPSHSPGENVEKTRRKSEKSSSFFRKYPRFGCLLIGTTLLYTGHMVLNNFTFQIIQSKGGGSAEMGITTALAAFWEMPTMFCFGFMTKKVRCDTWLRLSGLFFTVKAVLSWLVPSVGLFYAIQVFQMLAWALISVASVYYVNSIMGKDDAIKGQAYFTMTFTLGSVFGALSGGWLLDIVGVNTVLICLSAVTFIGTIIVFAAAQKVKEKAN